MSDQHEVTVYDRVAVRGRVSGTQVTGYLLRAGWLVEFQDEDFGSRRWRHHVHGLVTVDLEPFMLSDNIEEIARAEGRSPSAVLADIAKEPA